MQFGLNFCLGDKHSCVFHLFHSLLFSFSLFCFSLSQNDGVAENNGEQSLERSNALPDISLVSPSVLRRNGKDKRGGTERERGVLESAEVWNRAHYENWQSEHLENYQGQIMTGEIMAFE